MSGIIPVSRRLIFRGALGLGAALAAPAIVRGNRLPCEWEALAAYLDGHEPGFGRATAEHAFQAGLDLRSMTAIMLRGRDRERGEWPRLMFEAGPNGQRPGWGVRPQEAWSLGT